MKYKNLGLSDIKVSEICLGTMTFGEQTSVEDANSQLDYALANGINFLDTAELYPIPPIAKTYTDTETIIGNWLKNQNRDKVVIATKVAGTGRDLVWIRGGPKSMNEASIREAIEGSLKRLHTDYLDLYQLHWPARTVPKFGEWKFNDQEYGESDTILEQLQTLDKLVKEGKVRTIGLSNESPYGVMEFVRYARENNLPKVVTIQNAYGLLNRCFETGGLQEVCFHENIGLLPYSVLAMGYLTGKYIDNPNAVGRFTLFPNVFNRYEKINIQPAIKAYYDLAKKYNISLNALSHAFCFNQKFITSTIIGATNLDQLKENIATYNTQLSDEILAEIDEIHQRYPDPAP